MENMKDFINHLYAFTYIPVYYYSGNGLIAFLPELAGNYPPPEKYITAFLACNAAVSFLMTDFYCFYGCIKQKNADSFLLVGPISSIPYTNDIINSMRRDFFIMECDFETFAGYLNTIPLKTLNDFISYLTFLNHAINGTDDTPENVFENTDSISDEELSGKYVSQQYNDKDLGFINNSTDIERIFLTCIENGDLNGINVFINSNLEIKYGTIANNNLRQIKNMMIISTALSCRAAIRGGLSSETAFHLSDAYIQQIESSSNPDAIYTLATKILVDYTTRVSSNSLPLSDDTIIQQAIQFVHQNTNRHITVSDAAKHVGLSRAYLAHRFKEALGVDLSALIRRCKLEEAKELLRYTNKPISDISAYLCFSNQSHFQNSFKKQYGITPLRYRFGEDRKKYPSAPSVKLTIFLKSAMNLYFCRR